MPFYLGAAAFILAIFVLATGHRLLAEAEAGPVEPAAAEPAGSAQAAGGSGAAPEPRLEPLTVSGVLGRRAVVVAVGATPDAEDVVRAAAAIARRRGGPLEIVRVRETTVIEELAIDVEPTDVARAALREHVAVAERSGVPVTGLLLHSVGDHAAAARVIARHAAAEQAGIVAVGPSPRGRTLQFANGSFTATLAVHTPCTLVLVHPESELDEAVSAVSQVAG